MPSHTSEFQKSKDLCKKTRNTATASTLPHHPIPWQEQEKAYILCQLIV